MSNGFHAVAGNWGLKVGQAANSAGRAANIFLPRKNVEVRLAPLRVLLSGEVLAPLAFRARLLTILSMVNCSRIRRLSPLSHARPAWLLGALFGALILSSCHTGPRGVPVSEGILNFGRVSPTLFRGGQPDEQSMANLARLGVRTVINLRMPSDTWPGEEAAAHALGLAYIHVPLPGLSAPTDAQVAQVLALIATSPSPVFVHCEHGADRTGTIIASYRMQQDGWTAEQAFVEAKHYGFSALQFGMRHYILTRQPFQQ